MTVHDEKVRVVSWSPEERKALMDLLGAKLKALEEQEKHLLVTRDDVLLVAIRARKNNLVHLRLVVPDAASATLEAHREALFGAHAY